MLFLKIRKRSSTPIFNLILNEDWVYIHILFNVGLYSTFYSILIKTRDIKKSTSKFIKIENTSFVKE
jgi:hypothetical protein